MRYAPTVLRFREMQKRLEVTSCPNCSLYKTIFTSFKALLYTCNPPLNQLQCLFVHVQNPHELTSRPFCTRAKPPCKRSRTFCTRRKTSMQTFKDLLYTAQNHPANVQGPFVHGAKPSCKRSMPLVHDTKQYSQNGNL